MPTTAKNLWPQILAWDNLVLAAKEASRHKRYFPEIMRFNANLEENLLAIRDRLASGQWTPGHFRQFEVFEPKRRSIHAPQFSDRVVHHALVQIIGPFFERRFIDQSFACRKGKGTHAASKYLSHMLLSASSRFPRVFALKADISKYFQNIDHEILLALIARTIGDPNVHELMRSLVTKCSCAPGGKGLPLGALTSQLCANIYLDQLDHYAKETLRIRHYARYMDDFIILHGDKGILWEILAHIRDFLDARLLLTLNRKTAVFPAGQGIDFVGYRHWLDHVIPRKRNVKRAREQFKKLMRLYSANAIDLEYVRPRVASFLGYMRHCDSYVTLDNILEEFVLRRGEKD